jgi:hypothetical protein
MCKRLRSRSFCSLVDNIVTGATECIECTDRTPFRVGEEPRCEVKAFRMKTGNLITDTICCIALVLRDDLLGGIQSMVLTVFDEVFECIEERGCIASRGTQNSARVLVTNHRVPDPMYP